MDKQVSVFSIETDGKRTRIYINGVDVSRGVSFIKYEHDTSADPEVTLKLSCDSLTEIGMRCVRKGVISTNKKAFREALESAGMTQKQLAQAIGMAENSLSRKLLGRREFTLHEVISICKVLQIKDVTAVFIPELK